MIPIQLSVSPSNFTYEAKRTQATIELTIKRIVIAALALLNVAAIGGAYYYMHTFCPVKAEPILTSSLLAGVLGGLVSLKVPTCGITNYNMGQYLNPVMLLGRCLAYLFFGPVILSVKAIDWTNYSNRLTANQISREIRELSFKDIASRYGPNIRNLQRFGFLSKEDAAQFRTIYEEFLPLQMKEKHLDPYVLSSKKEENEDNPLSKEYSMLQGDLAQVEEKWKSFVSNISNGLPQPEISKTLPKFEKGSVRFRIKAKNSVQQLVSSS